MIAKKITLLGYFLGLVTANRCNGPSTAENVGDDWANPSQLVLRLHWANGKPASSEFALRRRKTIG
jgi:hypothetical protein